MTIETPITADAGDGAKMLAIAEQFLAKVEDRSAVVGILGMGYVGLPLAEAFIKVGMPVLGFDIQQKRVDLLKGGKTFIRHITDERVAAMNATGLFDVTIDFARLAEADALLICVPTPLNKYREPDLSYVIATAEQIGKTLRKSQLVALESTTYPGTTEEVIIPILEQASGLKAGVDFAIAYSPEREDPGNPDFSTTSIPKVVGADSDPERRMALALYSSFTQTVPVKDVKTAEAVKLTENIFRLVNIGLANELKFVFDGLGIDVWDVINAAKTKPFGYMAFYPGPGLGGHCIPIDPFYLTWKARAFGLPTRMIDTAGDITTALPRAVVERTSEALDHRMGKSLSSSKILIVGVAYKKNIDDLRESPALHILEILKRRGAQVEYYDPHVPTAAPIAHEHPLLADMVSIAWSPQVLKGFDCAVIVTDHDDVDYEALLQAMPLVIDTRNATARLDGRYADKVVKA
jgi:UDP-N-acetyl-D-glucosamine dehydrogenase